MTIKKTDEWNGYDFDNEKTRRSMKYLVVLLGDLDINGAYAFKSKKELKEYIARGNCPMAVFSVKDMTHKL